MSNSQSSIHKVANLLTFFRKELTTAFQKFGVSTTDETHAYLVHLLEGFTTIDPATSDEMGFRKPAAMLLCEAMNCVGDRRIEAYRRLGDVSLFNCGFFGEHLSRAPVSPDYYRSVGRTAYQNLDQLMQFKQPGGAFNIIFKELANKFDTIVDVFYYLSNSSPQNDPATDLLKRWSRGEAIDSKILAEYGLLSWTNPTQKPD